MIFDCANTTAFYFLEMPKGCVYFAAWGKSTAEATILPSNNHIWLKAK